MTKEFNNAFVDYMAAKTNSTQTIAYHGGFQGCRLGFMPGDNPYPQGGMFTEPSPEAKAWLQGWQDASEVQS